MELRIHEGIKHHASCIMHHAELLNQAINNQHTRLSYRDSAKNVTSSEAGESFDRKAFQFPVITFVQPSFIVHANK
jgi:hypothetical protein